MKFRLIIIFCTVAICAQAQLQQVSGRITDKATGEPLPAVTVSVPGSRLSSSSNVDGYFMLSGQFPDPLLLRFSCIGYQTLDHHIQPGQLLNNLRIQLAANDRQLDSVVVSSVSPERFKLNQQTGMIRMDPKLIATLPSLGEKDIFRAFQLMPGISAGNEQSAGLYVRGGTPDQNLVLFDGFTVYNVDHLFGFFSAFNANAIKDVQLFKGGFDAKYGGRLSALMDITGKEGNKNAFNAGIDLGFLSVNGFVETPLGKKMSALVAYRRSFETSFYDKLKDQATIDNEHTNRTQGVGERFRGQSDVKSHFDDLNVKLTYRTDSKDVFSWSVYHGKDDMDNSTQAGGGSRLGNRLSSFFANTTDVASWGNTGTSLKWSKQWNTKLYSNTLVSYSNYFSERTNTLRSSITDSLGIERKFQSGAIEDNQLYDYAARTDWTWSITPMHQLGSGIQYNYQDISYDYSRNDTLKLINRQAQGHTTSLYLQDAWSLDDHRFHLVPGIRTTYFSPTGKWYLEPRLHGDYQLTEQVKLKGSAGQYYQFAKRVIREDLLNGSRDFWLLADDDRIPVSVSQQYSAGISWEDQLFLVDMEAYVKNMKGLSEYTLRFQPMGGTGDYADFFYEGTGKAKGIDFLLQKKKGKYNGWIGYTLAEVTNDYAIYGPDQFFASNDIRNEFKMVHNYRLGRFDLSLSWMYMTGKPYTAPTGGYQVTLLDGTKQTYLNVSAKNALRLPDYHRLDAAVTFNFGRSGKFNGALGLSFFNLYDQVNTWYKKFDIIENEIVETDVNYLGFTPNLSLSIKLK
ncbi:TonB-dependent receptor [Paraflavitalea soli]|uniref:TonB-dependent receptor n=1 Tax=Paraflavitalea soli TaxID=2315862 RepID=A0A3B7MHR5_9BACT|nr:TonB-dependent receptor [Paraflavitalea soli]AXY72636.1 TonB-dependent receptor [Paraflavitalea soli]